MRAALRSRCSTALAPEVDCAAAPAHGERLHAAAQQEPAVEKLQTKKYFLKTQRSKMKFEPQM